MQKTASRLLFASLLAGLGFAAPASAAPAPNEFYVTIQGQKQGKLRGESTRKGQEGKMIGLAYDYGVKSPRDVATGQASGKRQHSPITFSKEWGASTPQLFQALVSNEVLTTVLFEFVRINPKTGIEEIFQTVKLTNAQLSGISHHTGPAPLPETKRAANDMLELEDISIVFQKIEIENKTAGTVASDSTFGEP